ncbi:MAG: hypothetical protein R2851_09090 [Caldilineaceae bacterium]
MLSTPERVNWLKSIEIFADTPDDVLDPIAAVLHESTLLPARPSSVKATAAIACISSKGVTFRST